MRVLVVGAGISGLAAARGLIAAGHEVTVLEQAPGLRLGGGAVTLWCNGTAILDGLGVGLEGEGQRLATLSLRTAGGRRVLEVDLEALAERFGSAARVIPRGSLITLLDGGLPAGTVRFGEQVADLRTDAGGVRVRTRAGREYGGDFLVGADGVHSRVRALLLGGGPAPLTGAATCQGLTPAPFDPGPVTTLMIGRRGDFGFMGAGDGLMQWFFDVPWPPGAPPWGRPLEMLRRRFAGWGPPVGRLLASLEDGDVEVFPHTRHKVPSRWGVGRCALLGDAAHGMPPVTAQGTNQALEDVAALVDRLNTVSDPAAVVGAYSAARRRRAALASAVASHSLAVSGPRTLLQSEHLMRVNGAVPPRLATRGFGRLLHALSGRTPAARG
ncbi:salicylate hydroxylase [Planomonospora parontospora subsp. parontospora]|uniref:Salicylate hydroxylase n=2 Tax=Planomonospora parontospora TaxID=58119 RepID=A0AA37BMB7_9ACTN|nr:NAD(P)/FAD-dependent oxidoreductase [Planomonospora parontospora]GGK89597.1 salicylate hydroxylase [Planomonospora parontospora]GII11742.1 salicylate hydroxylase [Planomonospora parontospora subsp. parontospora]